MSRAEFQARFRGRMMLFLTDAWAARRSSPSELGQLMESHCLQLKELLGEMYDSMQKPPDAPPTNGVAAAQQRKGATT